MSLVALRSVRPRLGSVPPRSPQTGDLFYDSSAGEITHFQQTDGTHWPVQYGLVRDFTRTVWELGDDPNRSPPVFVAVLFEGPQPGSPCRMQFADHLLRPPAFKRRIRLRVALAKLNWAPS